MTTSIHSELLREVLQIIEATNPVEYVGGLAVEDRKQASGADVVDMLCALEDRIRIAVATDPATVAAPNPRYDAWDENFARTIIGSINETRYVPVVEHRTPFAVGQLEEGSATQHRMDLTHRHRDGALLSGIPSLHLSTPTGADYFLTWQETYNLGAALIDVALVSLHG